MNVIELGPEIVFVRGLYRVRHRLYGADGMTIIGGQVCAYTPHAAIGTIDAFAAALRQNPTEAEVTKLKTG